MDQEFRGYPLGSSGSSCLSKACHMLAGAVLPEDSSCNGKSTPQWPCLYGCWPQASPWDSVNVLTVWWLASFQKNRLKNKQKVVTVQDLLVPQVSSEQHGGGGQLDKGKNCRGEDLPGWLALLFICEIRQTMPDT